jgi:hypothetical protein
MKNTILTLIQQDIKHTRFIEHLNAAGLTADQYYLNLSTVIFELLQLDRSTPKKADALQEGYFQLIQEIATTQTDTNEVKDAEQVFSWLVRV